MLKIRCPQCKKETEYSPSNPYRPFCSDRCKLIDLGDWADGKYSIPEPLTSQMIADEDEGADSD